MRTVTDIDLTSTTPLVVLFTAEWCGPCKAIKPILREFAELVGDAAEFVQVDVDKSEGLASRYGIKAMPTLMIIKGGRSRGKQIGLTPKKVIREWLEKKLNIRLRPSSKGA